MKILKKLSLIGLIPLSVFAATTPPDKEERFEGNWTKTFMLKDNQSTITHAPDKISLGWMSSGKGFTLKALVYNKMSMSKEGLSLKINCTLEDFENALIRSGLYKKDE